MKTEKVDEFVAQIQSCKALINKILYMYADSQEDRADLRQEILSQAWDAYQRFNGTAKFSTWLYRVSINVALTRLKKEKRFAQNGEDIPEEAYSFSCEKELLDQVLAVLNEIEKPIVLLLIEGYQREEIASILGVTAENLRVKIHRIRKKLEQANIHHFLDRDEQRYG